jgi:hypothetical protein
MKRLALLLVVLMGYGVLADISISEPMDIYNLGDRLYVEVDGLRGASSGNLNIDLVCGNGSINLVKISARAFSADEDQSYSIPYKILDREDLEILNLEGIVGSCQVVASLGSDVASTKIFEISDDVIVRVSLDKTLYNPGESVSVDIEAVKKNGVELSGFVEGLNASSFNKAIEDGKVSEVFVVPETAEAGTYILTVRAYDVGKDGVLNSGEGVVSYEVNQIATSLIMSLSDVVATPGENFTIGIEAFDQSGVEMGGLVSLKIISSDGGVVDTTVQAGEFSGIDFDLNSSVGVWRMVSSFDDLEETREFEMASLQKVVFDFEDSILSVRNVGNVLYDRTIDVTIGDEIMTLELNIGVGEVRKFKVGAPNGEYDVLVDDGETSISRQVLLTGNAISLKDFGNGGFFRYSIVYIFLILILGGIGGVLLMRYRKTRTIKFAKGWKSKIMKIVDTFPWRKKVARLHRARASIGKKVKKGVPNGVKSHMDDSLNFTRKSPAVQGLDVKNYSHEDKTMVDFTRKETIEAESALVLKGEKQVSGVVSVGIKNHGDLGDAGREALKEIVDDAKGKGVVDWRGDYIFVVFNPLITRTYKNEILAVRCGMKIVKKLEVYNKKFDDKVDFGVGVHAGDLVASKEKGKLKYTSIGNTISFAKRMSDIESAEIVVSDVVRKKLLRDLKVKKGKEIGENATYIVSEIKNRSGDAERLRELLKRSKHS